MKTCLYTCSTQLLQKAVLTFLYIALFAAGKTQVLYTTTDWNGAIYKLVTSSNTLTSVYAINVPQNGALIQAWDGKLYGMTSSGGVYGQGCIYCFNPSTATYTNLKDFSGEDGAYPLGSLVQASDGKLYGMSSQGGSMGYGVIFSYNPFTTTYTKLKDFGGADGNYPMGTLIQASNGKLYGMTNIGGSNDDGVIFSYDPVANIYTKLKDFTGGDGAYPSGSLTQASDGKLYGMTKFGGYDNIGIIFSFNPATFSYTDRWDFGRGDGAYPSGNLIQASDGKLYGMNERGGDYGMGVLFSFNRSTSDFTNLHDFENGGDGAFPKGSLTQASDGKIYGMTKYGGNSDAGVIFSYSVTSGTYTKLQEFNKSTGSNPEFTSFTEVCSTVYYRDADGDGFGNAAVTGGGCTMPPGYVTNSSDCDDTKLLYADKDSDGYGAGNPVACGVPDNTDANDADAAVHEHLKPDSTFAYTGANLYTVSGDDDEAYSIALKPDGKIVLAGNSNVNDYDLSVLVLNPDGTPDNSFGNIGKKTVPVGTSDDYGRAVAVQPNGKIVVAGYTVGDSYYDFCIVRLNADGSPDKSFNGSGKKIISLSPEDDYANSVLIQPDGKIVVAGYGYNGNRNSFLVIRLNSDGSFDNSFDGDGIKFIAIGSAEDQCYSAALQPDGKIILAGWSNDNDEYKIAVVRLNTNGSLDNSFDGGGKLLVGQAQGFASLINKAYAVTLQPDGKIVLAGATGGEGSENYALVRLNSNGSLDSSFNGKGISSTGIGTSIDIANAVAVQPDGKIVMSGYSYNSTLHYYNFSIARFNSNGSLDKYFDGDGKAILQGLLPSTDDHAQALAIQPDGKIIIAGYGKRNGFNVNQYEVIRITNTLDTATARWYYADSDGDGFGNLHNKVLDTIQPPGYVTDSSDCNDRNAAVHAGAIPAKPTISGSDILCTDGAAKLTSSRAAAYFWNTGDTTKDIIVTLPGAYTVAVTKASGCENISDTFIVSAKPCEAPANLYVEQYFPTYAVLSWDGISSVSLYTLRLKPVGSTTWQVYAGITVPGFATNGLTPGTWYAWQVQAVYGKTVTDFTKGPNFKAITKPVNAAVQSNLSAGKTFGFSVSPNPASTIAHIVLNGYNGNVVLLLMDMEGKQLVKKKVEKANASVQQDIDIAHIANGVYLVTVIDENGNRSTQKLVIAK